MAGVPTSRSLRRTALALGLCLLAFGFAMEAKLACYGPAVGSGRDIAAAKARPADLPEVVSHGVHAPDPSHSELLVVFVATLTAPSMWKAVSLLVRNSEYNHLSVSSAEYFSPSLFLRPPPIR